MMQRDISFLPEFIPLLLSGRKTQTRRPVKDLDMNMEHGCPYGIPGDLLNVKRGTLTHFGTDATFHLRIKSVHVANLVTISESDARAEGVASVEAFADLWDRIYGLKSFIQDPLVWVIGFALTPWYES